ncbi:K(+)-transporting ATPase subunit C [Raoultibacter massiliensis]|uniref:Potassium-transporting ATPase KdpC subunit n=1 Tax=Raoultibacter massiliensis TaxID=1852371 RepID=A0ABV1JD67_9ACTN
MKSAKTWGSSVIFFLLMTLITGAIYTAVCTGIAQLAFPYQANASIIEVDGVKYGSELVGQDFSDEDHMWGRIMNPNASTFTDDEGNPVMWYGASNLSPASEEFEAVVQERIEMIREAHPEKGDEPIPSDLVTCSGSGFDPEISPAAAEYQVERLAKNTGKSESEIREIIEKCTTGQQFGILGYERVNVLKVNLMLDGIIE